MPSKSAAQHRLMEMAAHDPAAARRVGVPQRVAKEFVEADKGRRWPRSMKARGEGRAMVFGPMIGD